MKTLVGCVGLALALSACSARGDAPRQRSLSSQTPRPGDPRRLSGIRLRADGPSLSALQAEEAARAGTYRGGASDSAYGVSDEQSYGPSGGYGPEYGPADGWGTVGPYGYPGGAVPPGLRAPSDTVLTPASPYRGPTDPPDVYVRPGITPGNSTYSHR